MRAIGLMRFGGPEVLQPIDIPLPEPGPGEIRIRVNGVVDAANQQALVLGAIADGGGLAEVRGWAGPSERNIAVHTIVANSVASDTKRLEQVRDPAEPGRLTLRVEGVLPAERAAEAHRRLDRGGLRGRLVLDFTR